MAATYYVSVPMAFGWGIMAFLLALTVFVQCRLQVVHYTAVSLKSFEEELELSKIESDRKPEQSGGEERR